MPRVCHTINAVVVICFAIVVASVRPIAAMGQAPAESPLVYHVWESFTTRDGLPHNSIRAIRIADDHVWVGTEGGLALYDGGTWKSWTTDEGLGSPVVTAIDVDARTDEVWIGTWGGGLVRFSAGRFDRFNQMNSGLAGDLVLAVRVAGGRVWTATSAGISSFDSVNDTWELHFPRRANTPEMAVTSLTVADGSLYAAGWGGEVQRFDLDHGDWSLVDGLERGQPASPAGVRYSHGGALGITSIGRSLWLLEHERLCRRYGTLGWEAHSISPDPEAGGFIRCLAAHSETEAWVGTNNGLRALVDWPTNTWLTYRRCKDLDISLITMSRQGRTIAAQIVRSTIPDNRIRCVTFGQDDVWVGTVNGLARGSGPKRWSDLPVCADSTKTTCPQPEAVVSVAHTADAGPAVPGAVTIAVLGPVVRSIVLPKEHQHKLTTVGRADPLAVQLAVHEANAHGGYRGHVPFLLAAGAAEYERYGWVTPEDDFARFLHRDGALGIVAYVGPGQVIRNAVASRTEVPVVNSSDSPPDGDEEANPWIFRCPGDDPRQHARMVKYIVKNLGHTRFAVLRAPDPMARRHLNLWARYARDHVLTSDRAVAEIDYDPGADHLDEALRKVASCDAQVVLSWYDEAVSASVLRRMRELGMTQLFVGSEQVVTDEFLKLAGPNPGPVLAPYSCPHRRAREALARFAKRYTAQYSSPRMKREPTIDAYLAYHATCHLLQAVDLAGPNRDAVRRMLVKMGDARLAVLKHGQWETVTLPHR